MARSLSFVYEGQPFACAIDKVDRAALYGSVDVETHDANGLRCETATLANDGRTLIPSGGTAFGYVRTDGQWIERADLKPVDAYGRLVNQISSSFDGVIELDTKTSPERFLDHAIRSAYALDPVAGVPGALSAALASGAIFKFDFSYRGGISADPAFLMQGADGTVWMLVGDEMNVSYLTFNQAAPLADDDDAAADSDDLDFEMM
jgi:hypothetical protein